jgi:hypothetical protein
MNGSKQARCPVCGVVVNVHPKSSTFFAHGKLADIGQEPALCSMSDQPVTAPNPQKPLFPLGQVVATPGALDALNDAGQGPSEFLRRHVTGDWGNLDEHDRQENELALKEGHRLFSAYQTSKGVRIWIITEWDRSVTTILLPSDY